MKDYDDYRLATESTQKIIRQKFDESMDMEVKDLEDIYEKMLEQKKQLEANNPNGSLDSAIHTTNENLSELESLIKKYSKVSYIKSSSNLQKNPQFSGNFYDNKIKSFNLPNTVQGKIPSSEEIARHSTNNTTPTPNMNMQSPSQPQQNMYNSSENGAISPNLGNTSPVPENGVNSPNLSNNPINENTNISDENLAISPRNNEAPSRNSRRGNPMQGNILSIIAKTLFVKNKHNKGKISGIDNYQYIGANSNTRPIIADSYRNRFHNTFIQSEPCDPRRKLVTGQVDLLRLLILFIALRPHSRYCARIASIVNNQFEVLLNLT